MSTETVSIETTDPQERAAKAVNCLLEFTHNDPVLLVFFDPAQKGKPWSAKPSCWLTEDTRDQAVSRLVQAESNGWNCYWQVNQVREDFHKPKPSKKGITLIRAVFADLDPDDDKPFEDARRELKEAVAFLPEPLQPTLVVDSGNGLQPLWRLKTPVEARSHQDPAEALGKRIGRIKAFSGLKADGVQNIDRVLRVPFMRNYPDSGKQAKGRKPRLAGVFASGGPDYDLETLATAVAAIETETRGIEAQPVLKPTAKAIKAAFPPVGGVAVAGMAANVPQKELKTGDPAFDDLGDTLKADMLTVVPALTQDQDFAHLWNGEHEKVKNKKTGEFFSDRSSAVHSLLVQIARKLAGSEGMESVSVERLHAVAEQSPMIETVYRDKWSRNGGGFGLKECEKALETALKYEQEDLAKKMAARDLLTPVQSRTLTSKDVIAGPLDDSDSALCLCSDLANANRLQKELGEKVLFTEAFGPLVWNGRRWEPNEMEARAQCQKLSRIIAAEAANYAQKAKDSLSTAERMQALTANEELSKWAMKCEAAYVIGHAYDLLKVKHQAQASRFNQHPLLFNCANGVADLRTGALLPHDSSLYLTQESPIEYHPEAQCPQFLAFIDAIFAGDQELIEFMHCLIGYCLTGETSEQVFIVLWGSGGNGKSTLVELLSDILGPDYYGTLLPDELAPKKGGQMAIPERVNVKLEGKRLVTAAETEESGRLHESFVKSATGGDTLSGRRLYKDSHTFKPVHKLWLSTNHKPQIINQDEGIWRRLVLVPFTQTFSGSARDPQMKEKLRGELPGILAWAVQGAVKWAQMGRLNKPQAVLAAIDEYRDSEDICLEFVNSQLDLSDPNATTPYTTVYSTYQLWCNKTERRALSNKRWGANELDRVFKKLGRGYRKKTSTGQVCEGVKLSQNSVWAEAATSSEAII